MSRHASPRGGFLLHALRLFEIARVLIRVAQTPSIFIRTDNKTPSVVAMRVCNPDCFAR
jgi:hypothetical protein